MSKKGSPLKPTGADTPHKIYPRNLTARAAYVVTGNPMSTRPESGVGNSYPGLEYDLRNLDKAFFPGLRFDFHRDDGAILRSVDDRSDAAAAGLARADLTPVTGTGRLYLWAVLGRTAPVKNPDEIPLQLFNGLGGLDVWARVHDLAPGRIAILIGPYPGQGAQIPNGAVTALRGRLDAKRHLVRRDLAGALAWAVLVGERARYLDDAGVIDPEVYDPGDLTRSLCVPWQYDFRDCGCFYWASNKPDLVASADGSEPYLNFQRRDRGVVPDLRPPANQDWPAVRDAAEIDYAPLIEGGWNDLAIVLNDRESTMFNPAPVMHRRPKSLTQVKKELRYLATVEHAVSVEYLYAHYSINTPYAIDEAALEDLPETYSFDQRAPRVPANLTAQQTRIFIAAMEIFRIAVDEMRHLHWANEALFILSEPPECGRARTFGAINGLPKHFKLQPLTPEQLQWFIDVEKPSQVKQDQQGTVDGMYVWLLDSIERAPQQFPQAERLIELLKLIIDEGGGHYHRFLRVQEQLRGIPPRDYLIQARTDPGARVEAMLDLSDAYYANLLTALQLSFSAGEHSDGQLLNQSRRFMYGLHDINHQLAHARVMPKFTLPKQLPTAPRPRGPRTRLRAQRLRYVDGMESRLQKALTTFAKRVPGSAADQDMAARFRTANETTFATARRFV